MEVTAPPSFLEMIMDSPGTDEGERISRRPEDLTTYTADDIPPIDYGSSSGSSAGGSAR